MRHLWRYGTLAIPCLEEFSRWFPDAGMSPKAAVGSSPPLSQFHARATGPTLPRIVHRSRRPFIGLRSAFNTAAARSSASAGRLPLPRSVQRCRSASIVSRSALKAAAERPTLPRPVQRCRETRLRRHFTRLTTFCLRQNGVALELLSRPRLGRAVSDFDSWRFSIVSSGAS
jgi:hypothetical protein